MEEQWKPIPGYDQFYEASNFGRIRSFGRYDYGGRNGGLRWKKPCMLKITPRKKGYSHVNLYDKNGGVESCSIHSLVLKTFKGLCPEGLVGRHLDGDKNNNTEWNLVYGTYQDNADDAISHGTTLKGEKNPQAKLTQTNVESIMQALKYGETSISLAEQYNISVSCIRSIKQGKRWSHLTGISSCI